MHKLCGYIGIEGSVLDFLTEAPWSLDRGDRMLEDEMIAALDIQQNREFIKSLDAPLQFQPAQQVEGNYCFFFSESINEFVLYP